MDEPKKKLGKPFRKGHPKYGGRKKGTPNHATAELKELLNTMLSRKKLERLWKRKLFHKDPAIAMKAFEMAQHYMFGKPQQPLVGEEHQSPIHIDISAIPKFRVKAEDEQS